MQAEIMRRWKAYGLFTAPITSCRRGLGSSAIQRHKGPVTVFTVRHLCLSLHSVRRQHPHPAEHPWSLLPGADYAHTHLAPDHLQDAVRFGPLSSTNSTPTQA